MFVIQACRGAKIASAPQGSNEASAMGQLGSGCHVDAVKLNGVYPCLPFAWPKTKHLGSVLPTLVSSIMVGE